VWILAFSAFPSTLSCRDPLLDLREVVRAVTERVVMDHLRERIKFGLTSSVVPAWSSMALVLWFDFIRVARHHLGFGTMKLNSNSLKLDTRLIIAR
jgi:hypothetical protein